MRAYGFRLLLGVLLLGSGCTEINNYGCEVVDGGQCMRGYAGDHDNDDELAFDSGPRAPTGIFTPDSKLQDNADVSQGAPPRTLVDAVVTGNIPQLVTVNLATPIGQRTVPIGPLAGTYGETVAILDIGVGGTAYQAEVDYGVGVQFSLLMSRLRVSCEYRTLAGAATPVPAPTINLAASIGQGVVAVPRAPTRTLGYAWVAPSPGMPPSPAPGFDMLFTVPMFAKSVIIYARSTAGVPVVNAAFFGLAGNGIWSTPVAAFPSAEIPLTNEVRTILLANVGGVNIFDLRLVFVLAL